MCPHPTPQCQQQVAAELRTRYSHGKSVSLSDASLHRKLYLSLLCTDKTIFSPLVYVLLHFLMNKVAWKYFFCRKHSLAVKWTCHTCGLGCYWCDFFSPSASGSAGKGSRLPDLGPDYKPPMSGKAPPAALLTCCRHDTVLLYVSKHLL